ncbi:zf-HC2 domain-containing protein [Streptomyces sp. NPDC004539]|uniref:anti-sigma factor family protein n=1 Tax=Streptomyces sp. NPDC004539 TaxID=3154280 RepID=UPI0033B1171E
MSGLGGSRPKPSVYHAEQHLGDRLSALVDGELGHDARERVLAHVATCPKCKAEVDEQRRLKSVFSEVAPPAPSESFLARLQGLPGGGGPEGPGSPLGGGALGADRGSRLGSRGFGGLGGTRGSGGFGDSEPFGSGPVFGGRPGEPFEFGYLVGEEREGVGAGDMVLPAGEASVAAEAPGMPGAPGVNGGTRVPRASVRASRASAAAAASAAADSNAATAAAFSASVAGKGFPVHPVVRHEERSRSMRFAFVAAGAVSLAAIALGGVTGSAPIDQSTEARGGAGSNVTPSRAPGSGAAVPDSSRRRSAGPLLSQGGQGVLRDAPAAPTEVAAPLLPGIPTPASARHEEALRALTAPVVAGAAAMSPLIRPLSVTWPTTPGLLSPDATSAPEAR